MHQIIPATDNSDHADMKIDLFALGSEIYFMMMMSHEVFPELDVKDDDEEVERRFRNGHFPRDAHACTAIIEKCWKQHHHSVREVIEDIINIQLQFKISDVEVSDDC